MQRTNNAKQENGSKDNESATVEQRRALLSLSWYSSVLKAGAHLTLSRVSVPQTRGGSSSRTRVWLASRSETAGPRSAWRVAFGNDSVVGIKRAEMNPRHKSKNSLHLDTSLENQGLGILVAHSGAQDTGGTTSRGHTGDAYRLGTF